jgi:hypothetical protein
VTACAQNSSSSWPGWKDILSANDFDLLVQLFGPSAADVAAGTWQRSRSLMVYRDDGALPIVLASSMRSRPAIGLRAARAPRRTQFRSEAFRLPCPSVPWNTVIPVLAWAGRITAALATEPSQGHWPRGAPRSPLPHPSAVGPGPAGRLRPSSSARSPGCCPPSALRACLPRRPSGPGECFLHAWSDTAVRPHTHALPQPTSDRARPARTERQVSALPGNQVRLQKPKNSGRTTARVRPRLT